MEVQEQSTESGKEDEEKDRLLDLSGAGLSKEDLTVLCKTLASDDVVTTLNVSKNCFMEKTTNTLERGHPRHLLPYVKQPKEWNTLHWEILEAFSEALRQNRRLHSLLMADTEMGSMGQHGIVTLCHALNDHDAYTSIITLDLSGSMILGESRMRYNGLVALCDFLKESSNLQNLTLRRNYLHSEALKFLAAALMKNKSLRKLDLEDNLGGRSPQGTASVVGIQSLALWLKNYSRLKSMNLAQNQLGNEEAVELGSALESMTTLEVLDVCNNNIKATGLQALCRCLPFNESLTELRLAQNRFYDDGVLILFRLLTPNHHLLRLNLTSNNLTHYASEGIELALQKNYTLRYLDVAHNAFFGGNVHDFEHHLAVNRTLVELERSTATTTHPTPRVIVSVHDQGAHEVLLPLQQNRDSSNQQQGSSSSAPSFDIRTKRKKFRDALLQKLHLLDTKTLHILRDENESIRSDARYMERLLELVPYSRKEILAQSLEYVSQTRANNQEMDAKSQAIQTFLVNNTKKKKVDSSSDEGSANEVSVKNEISLGDGLQHKEASLELSSSIS